MKVYPKEAKIIGKAIAAWREEGMFTDEQAAALDASVEVIPFNWKKLARYAFLASIACVLIAVGAALSDKYLKELLEVIFKSPYSLKCLSLSVMAGAFYAWGFRAKTKRPERIYSNEFILFFGVVATAGAVFMLGHALGLEKADFSPMFLVSCAVYAAIAYAGRSKLIWVYALVTLGGWLGTRTGYASGWGAYYLGMNFPLRFVLFGGALTAAGLFLPRFPKMAFLGRVTLVMGLMYLFISLWIMSIFGNYGDVKTWSKVSQFELLHWSLLFAAVAAAAILHGLKYDNGVTKGFGLTFLGINLYTRYFEFFWNAAHKAIFFAVLAISLWLAGRKAESIWNLGRTPGSGKE